MLTCPSCSSRQDWTARSERTHKLIGLQASLLPQACGDLSLAQGQAKHPEDELHVKTVLDRSSVSMVDTQRYTKNEKDCGAAAALLDNAQGKACAYIVVLASAGHSHKVRQAQ